MKNVLIGFCILALALIPSFGASAETPAETPALGTSALSSAIPDDTPIFLSSIDDGSVDDAAYNACCQAGFAACAASCVLGVRSWSCTPAYPRGCSTSCSCF